MNHPAIMEHESLKEDFIAIEDFDKIGLRAGTVVTAEAVHKSDKLLNLQVDFGETQLAFLIDDSGTLDENGLPIRPLVPVQRLRTVLAGIAKSFKPEDVIGKQFVFITNLPPRKMMGIMSEGMILAAAGNDGTLVLVSPTGPVTPGVKLG